MPNALIVVDKDTVDEAEALGRKFAKGQVRANEDTGELEFYDGTNWNTYVGTTFATRAAGDIIRRNTANTAWERVALGAEGTVLRSAGTFPTWANIPESVNIFAGLFTNPPFSVVADNQAGLILSAAQASLAQWVIYDILVQIVQADNALISWDVEVHDPGHTILETHNFQFPPFGAGNLIKTAVMVRGPHSVPVSGSYHLNTTAITLNGGTITGLNRLLWGRLA